MITSGITERARLLGKANRALRVSSAAGTFALGLTLLLPSVAQAQSQYAVSDSQLQNDVNSALKNDAQLKGAKISTSASSGVVTLTGTVANEQARDEAEGIAAGVNGVRSIQDNINVAGGGAPAQSAPAEASTGTSNPPDGQVQTTAQNGMPPPPPAAPGTAASGMPPAPPDDQVQDQAQSAQGGGYTQYPNGNAGAPPPPSQQGSYPQQGGYPQGYPNNGGYNPRSPYAPPQGQQGPPPQPTLAVAPDKQDHSGPVSLPPGTLLNVRIAEPLATGKTKPGDFFQVTAAADIYAAGVIAIPRGAVLTGQVIESKNAGPFGGSPTLELKLTAMTLGANTYPLVSDMWSSKGPSKNGYTATNTVGGAAFGALIGAVAGGGVGAGVGAIAGGATGAAVSGATRGPHLELPPETLLQFHLAQPITVQPVTYSEAARLATTVPQGVPARRIRPAYPPYGYAVRPYPYGYPAPY